MKQANLGDFFKKASKSVCISTVAFPDLLCPAPWTSAAKKIPEIKGEDPDYPEPTDEGDIQTELLLLVVQPIYKSGNNKITCENLRQYRYRLVICNIQLFNICLVPCKVD